jgi:hypothetical protein
MTSEKFDLDLELSDGDLLFVGLVGDLEGLGDRVIGRGQGWPLKCQACQIFSQANTRREARAL